MNNQFTEKEIKIAVIKRCSSLEIKKDKNENYIKI